MLYYNKIDLRKGIDLTKSYSGKEYVFCHYWYFNHAFRFRNSVMVVMI